MSNVYRVKRRAAGGPAGAPSSLLWGELAFNEQDLTLYYGNGDAGGGVASSVIAIGGSGAFISLVASRPANTVLAAPNGAAGAPSFRALVAADIPTLNQNTTGTAANVTGTVAIGNGGTGQTSQQAAMNSLAGGVGSGLYLRGDGANVTLSGLSAGDLSGTIPSAVLGNSTIYIGTTAIPLNRPSGPLTLTGVSGVGGGSVEETGPSMTYTSGVLTRVDYDSGNYKTFVYTEGVLTQLDYVVGATTTRKTFNYNPDGSLASIDQTVL